MTEQNPDQSSANMEHTPDVAEPSQASVVRRIVDWMFAPWMADASEAADSWQEGAHRSFLEQRPLRARKLLYGVAIVAIALILWASWAELDEVTRGQGRVIPSSRIQIIQSQDGGVITEILVREGDIVAKDQLLVRLDNTRSQSTYLEYFAEFQAMSVKAARLKALAEGVAFEPDRKLVIAVPGIVYQEVALYDSRKAEFDVERKIAEQQLVQRNRELEEVTARKNQMARSLSLVQQELKVTLPMVPSGAVSKIEILRMRREVNQLDGEYKQSLAQSQVILSSIKEAQSKLSGVAFKFNNVVREELTETLARLNGLREAGAGLSDRVAQTEVRSPVRGTIKQLYFNTVGGVVLPGKEIVEVVPLDDALLLEARIKPQDIAFLIPGQKALVKFSAYDFVVYGGMEGVVEHIGADTVVDEEGNPYYNVRVRTLLSNMGHDRPIIPGMTVEVDILTGKKTVLAYLMKPVLRAKQLALTER